MDTALLALAVLFGALGMVSGVLALRTLGRLRSSVALLSRGASGRETILDVAESHMKASEAVRRDILDLQRDLLRAQSEAEQQVTAEREQIAATVAGLQTAVGQVLSRVAMVRYDAFDDLSGRLSFALALLDEHGSGITLSSVASSSQTRLYAKSLSRGVAEHTLSPEEEQAVKAALSR